jgi:hypothetical protein
MTGPELEDGDEMAHNFARPLRVLRSTHWVSEGSITASPTTNRLAIEAPYSESRSRNVKGEGRRSVFR